MGMQFYRRIKIFPGVTANLSKSGVSLSFGVKGLRYTLGNGKKRITIGLPGTGIRYTNVNRIKYDENFSEEKISSNGFDFNLLVLICFFVLSGLVVVCLDAFEYAGIFFILITLFLCTSIPIHRFAQKTYESKKQKEALKKIRYLQILRNKQRLDACTPQDDMENLSKDGGS